MNKRAFTLIEISIAIVIVGLVIGGILVGNHLIEQAQLRATVKYVEDLKVAFKDFQSSYNCLPGDCAKANRLGLGDNGDGNGIVDVSAVSFVGEGRTNMFTHLNTAGLLSGGLSSAKLEYGRYFIPTKINGAYVFMVGSSVEGNNKMALVIGKYGAFTGMGTVNGLTFRVKNGLSPDKAQRLDALMDDGLPDTGSVLAISAYNSTESNTELGPLNRTTKGVPTSGASGTASCLVTGTPNKYNSVITDSDLCALMIKFP